jgi:hypothetical protein
MLGCTLQRSPQSGLYGATRPIEDHALHPAIIIPPRNAPYPAARRALPCSCPISAEFFDAARDRHAFPLTQ